MNALDDSIVAILDEGVNVVGAHGCRNRNQYQLFGFKRLVLGGQMQARVLRSDVLASIAGCVIIYGNQAVQELVWALLQAQQATINVLDLVARDQPVLDHGKVLPHR